MALGQLISDRFEGEMKKFIGIVLCLLLIIGCVMVADVERKEETKQTAIETEQIKYLTDADLSRLYTCKQDIRKRDSAIVSVTYEEAQLLMKIGISEAGDDTLGQLFVMLVVVNRLNDPAFPNTIKEIIYQSKQFSPIANGRFDKAEPTVSSHEALYLLEAGNIKIDALYFESVNVKNSWQSKNRELLFTYGGHRFYK